MRLLSADLAEEFAGHHGSEVGPREFFLQRSKGPAEHTPLDGGDVDADIENEPPSRPHPAPRYAHALSPPGSSGLLPAQPHQPRSRGLGGSSRSRSWFPGSPWPDSAWSPAREGRAHGARDADAGRTVGRGVLRDRRGWG